jgi:hypothetical protein
LFAIQFARFLPCVFVNDPTLDPAVPKKRLRNKMQFNNTVSLADLINAFLLVVVSPVRFLGVCYAEEKREAWQCHTHMHQAKEQGKDN